MGRSHRPEAVQQVAARLIAGDSQHQAAAVTGIPRRTIRRWTSRPDVAQLIKDARAEQALRYHGLVDRLLDQLEADAISLPPVQLMIAHGIAQDKYDRQQHGGTSVTFNIQAIIAEREAVMRAQRQQALALLDVLPEDP